MGFFVPRPTLPLVAGAAAVIVGFLMAIAGLGLMLAIVSSVQPPLQVATAGVLMVAGAINLFGGRAIRQERPRSLGLSWIATMMFLAYSGAVIRDFGELFWMSAAFVLLLTTPLHRPSSSARIAG